MNVSFEKSGAVNGKLTVKLEKTDYAAAVDQSLKNLKKKVNMPGFRPGMVPVGMIKKMYGNEVKAEEINKKLSEAVNNYVQEQKLRLVADPMVSEGQPELDIVNGEDYEFSFDLGLAPEISVELTGKDKITFYTVLTHFRYLSPAVIQTYLLKINSLSKTAKYFNRSDFPCISI